MGGWYNDEHRHSGIRYVTPGQRHCGQDQAILAASPRAVLQGPRPQASALVRRDTRLDTDRLMQAMRGHGNNFGAGVAQSQQLVHNLRGVGGEAVAKPLSALARQGN